MTPEKNDNASIYDALLQTLGSVQSVRSFLCLLVYRIQDNNTSETEKEHFYKIVTETILEMSLQE